MFMKKWTEQEIAFLKKHYPNKGKMWCAQRLNRGEGSIRWMASMLGLKQDQSSPFFNDWQKRAADSKVGKQRPEQAEVMKRNHREGKFVKSKEQCEAISERMKEWHKKNEHPRGATGLKFSPETRKRMSEKCRQTWKKKTPEELAKHIFKTQRAKAAKSGTASPRKNVTWKSGWRTIGGKRKYYRSKWEANYARYLEWLKQRKSIADWQHEPETFWFNEIKRGCVSYLPDFKVIENNGKHSYHEVKGWMDDRSKTKLRRMAKYYPEETLVLIESVQYKAISRQVGRIIDGWE